MSAWSHDVDDCRYWPTFVWQSAFHNPVDICLFLSAFAKENIAFQQIISYMVFFCDIPSCALILLLKPRFCIIEMLVMLKFSGSVSTPSNLQLWPLGCAESLIGWKENEDVPKIEGRYKLFSETDFSPALNQCPKWTERRDLLLTDLISMTAQELFNTHSGPLNEKAGP